MVQATTSIIASLRISIEHMALPRRSCLLQNTVGMKTTRREFLQTSAAAALAGCGGAETPTGPSARMCCCSLFSDQQHARTVSAYGGTPVNTPQTDRNRTRGCRFDNAISIYPVCSPYRGMLMSGLYPMRNGVVGNDTPLADGLPLPSASSFATPATVPATSANGTWRRRGTDSCPTPAVRGSMTTGRSTPAITTTSIRPITPKTRATS